MNFQLSQRVNVPGLKDVQGVIIGGSIDPVTGERWRLVWFQSNGAPASKEVLDEVLRNANKPAPDHEAASKIMASQRDEAIDRACRAERALASLRASRKTKRRK